MRKKNYKKYNSILVSIVVFIFFIFAFSFVFYSGEIKIIGYASSNQTGVVNFTQAGSAGIVLQDDLIEYGAGYYNETCGTDYSILDSSDPFNPGQVGAYAAPKCWINTSRFLRNSANLTGDFHMIENNGSTVLNISVISDRNAKDFVCGIGGSCLGDKANFSLLAFNNEPDSCSLGLQSTYLLMSNDTANLSVSVCDRFNYDNSKDSILIYYKTTVPADIPTGVKELIVTYQAIAL